MPRTPTPPVERPTDTAGKRPAKFSKTGNYRGTGRKTANAKSKGRKTRKWRGK